MLALVALLAALSTGLYTPAQTLIPPPPAFGVLLRYDPPLGQVARYRVSLNVEGQQISLGERLPVAWKAEAEVTEEVVAKGADGSFWLRTSAKVSRLSGGNGMFANGAAAEWPEVRLHLSQTGEVLESAQAGVAGASDARERALAALITESNPLVLPTEPVGPGDTWEVGTDGARQRSRLLLVEGEGDSRIARISTVATWPLAVDEIVSALGLETHLTGEARQTSETELLLATGTVCRQTGRTHLVTRSRVTLSLPDGNKVFSMKSDLSVAFDVLLVSVDGRPVARRQSG
ncbi:MAG: hypothetical protein ACE149_01750 [Armatimonadota bacterium]